MNKFLTKITLAVTAMTCLVFAFSACNSDSDNSGNTTTQVTSTQPMSRVSLSVYDPSGTLVYSDSNSSTSLKLTSGINYNFHLTSANAPTGTTFNVQATDIDLVNGTPTTTTMSLGDNAYTPPTPGDFTFTLTPTGQASATVATTTYQASISCSNPIFTAASLSPQSLTVSTGSGTNLYTFSAGALTSNANGTGPYLCAWDVDGDGIQDTPFKDCSTSVSDVYANDVGTRTIGVIVKDACNTAQTATKSLNLAYSVPTKPGNVFIFGQVSNPTGTVAGDLRIDGVNYLATNSGGHNIVKPEYSAGANGTGSFTITSSLSYGLLSSVAFGMGLNVGNISDTLNLTTMSGTVDASAATLNKTTYSTDLAGDQSPARSLSGTQCQLTNPGAKVTFQQGTPCSAGTTGDNNSADVEVWGDYVCSVSDSGGSATITGSFDGIAHLADNCVGGGGGGGGGINPVGL